MPIYEYRCKACGRTFEQIRRIQDADRDVMCPDCRSMQVERLLSAFNSRGCSPSSAGGRSRFR